MTKVLLFLIVPHIKHNDRGWGRSAMSFTLGGYYYRLWNLQIINIRINTKGQKSLPVVVEYISAGTITQLLNGLCHQKKDQQMQF